MGIGDLFRVVRGGLGSGIGVERAAKVARELFRAMLPGLSAQAVEPVMLDAFTDEDRRGNSPRLAELAEKMAGALRSHDLKLAAKCQAQILAECWSD